MWELAICRVVFLVTVIRAMLENKPEIHYLKHESFTYLKTERVNFIPLKSLLAVLQQFNIEPIGATDTHLHSIQKMLFPFTVIFTL